MWGGGGREGQLWICKAVVCNFTLRWGGISSLNFESRRLAAAAGSCGAAARYLDNIDEIIHQFGPIASIIADHDAYPHASNQR